MLTIEQMKRDIRAMAPNFGPMPYNLGCMLKALDELDGFREAAAGWPAERMPPEYVEVAGEWSVIGYTTRKLTRKCYYDSGSWYSEGGSPIEPPERWTPLPFRNTRPADDQGKDIP